MNFEKATKRQLLTIALYEPCPLEYKYRAARELQMRWTDEMLVDLVRLYGQGKEVWEIAEYLGISESVVKDKILSYRLYRGRIEKCKNKNYLTL
jgi:transposase-like protein